MDFLEHLAAQKREGEREFAEKQQRDRDRQDAEAARATAEDELRRKIEEEKNLRKAREVFDSLPALVRQAAKNGLPNAVINSGFVEDHKDSSERCDPVTIDKKTYYFKGWQIPFLAMCKEHGVPLTVLTERVDTGLNRVLKRSYFILAIDMSKM